MRRVWASVMSVWALFVLVTAITRAPSGRNN